MRLIAIVLACSLPTILIACAGQGSSCSGFTVTGSETKSTFTVQELMAHSASMGMTQQEAETLIYLEGISPATKIEPGETICIDGKPG
jgi:hypothetical protein